jgi:hypothetical protein
MAYSLGGLIEATDYNNFVGNTAAGLNRVWSAGATDHGYGQSSITTVSAGGLVSATNWATLVNTLAAVGSHQGTALTSRTAPTAGGLVQVLANVSADITSVTTNRNNAAASGTEFIGWTGTSSKTTATGSGQAAWTITFTHTITWANAASARYFFNAGGRIKWQTRKSSTGTPADAEWNNMANTLNGSIFITGVGASKTIAAVAYTGTTKSGGTGTPAVLTTATGWYNLTTSDTEIYRQNSATFPYTGQFIRLQAKTAGTGTQLVLTTTWSDPGSVGQSYAASNISGGTATTGVTFGTAPATVVTYFPPSTNQLTNTWGTPTVVASVA